MFQADPEGQRRRRLNVAVTREIATEVNADVETFIFVNKAGASVNGPAVIAKVAPRAGKGCPVLSELNMSAQIDFLAAGDLIGREFAAKPQIGDICSKSRGVR